VRESRRLLVERRRDVVVLAAVGVLDADPRSLDQQRGAASVPGTSPFSIRSSALTSVADTRASLFASPGRTWAAVGAASRSDRIPTADRRTGVAMLFRIALMARQRKS
jgi:hypothetical protein